MTTETTGSEPQPRKSLDEIAAMMAENTLKMRGQLPNEGADDDNTETDDVGETDSDQGRADSEDDTGSAESGVASEGDDDGDDASADDGTVRDDDDDGDTQEQDNSEDGSDFDGDGDFEITEDTLFQLDDDTEVTFADIKKAYSANKDQIALVEEQRTATEAALVERQKAAQEVDAARQAAVAVFDHFEKLVAQPLINKPDPNLKTTNPEQYIRHLDAYEQDQLRIAQNKEDLTKVFQEHLNKQEELKKGLKEQVITKLHEVLPQLKSPDENVRKTASKDIIDAAVHYGFSQDEVNDATDPRLYQMAHDAQQYRKLMSKAKKGEQVTVDKEEKATKVRNQTRTLRPRGTTAKQRLSAKAKRVKTAKATAKKSGKVDDVADFIAAKRS